MTFEEISDAILGGATDDRLDEIIETVQTRRKAVAQRQLATIPIGARVRVKGGIRPKYMIGATGEVTGRTATRIDVKLDEPVGRFGTDHSIGFPPGTLEVL